MTRTGGARQQRDAAAKRREDATTVFVATYNDLDPTLRGL